MRATQRRRPQLLDAVCLVAFLPCLKVAGQEASAAQGTQRTVERFTLG